MSLHDENDGEIASAISALKTGLKLSSSSTGFPLSYKDKYNVHFLSGFWSDSDT